MRKLARPCGNRVIKKERKKEKEVEAEVNEHKHCQQHATVYLTAESEVKRHSSHRVETVIELRSHNA